MITKPSGSPRTIAKRMETLRALGKNEIDTVYSPKNNGKIACFDCAKSRLKP